MGRIEVLDKHSGAILFKKDEEALELDKAKIAIEDLEKRVSALEKIVKKLTK